MSTEIPKTEKKKDKKDKSEKKRKREHAEDASTNGEPTLKKKKKDRKSEEKPSTESNGVEKSSKQQSQKGNTPDERREPVAETQVHTKKKKKSKGTLTNGLSSRTSPFVQVTESFYVTLSPCANHFPLEGACAEHISPLLLTYYPPLGGVILSYSDPRLSEHPQGFKQKSNSDKILAKSVDEYGVTFIWLTAEFLVFRPTKGAAIEGYVSLQNESVLGLVCYNYFNAAIERQFLPSDWKWTGDNKGEAGEAEGYYVDGEGKKVDGKISFRVVDLKADITARTITINGTLLPEGQSAPVTEASSSKKKKRKEKA